MKTQDLCNIKNRVSSQHLNTMHALHTITPMARQTSAYAKRNTNPRMLCHGKAATKYVGVIQLKVSSFMQITTC